MSRTIDEKVVEMRFDNADFERNVSQSMSTLDKLKSALDFSGAEKAFSGISSAASNVNFGGLFGALDEAGEKFSVFKTIAVGALMNVGASIENWVVDKLKSISTDQFFEGFNKYAEKTTAVQTIMNATGRDIEDVSDKLATLNWFTDETSYNFTDMTNSIGKFTSQGVALEDAVSAMEGISTAAALAGQNTASASRVMYNFSQSLGMGAVKLQDWMSVENANMATQEFKQTIIDTAIELGRLDKYGNIENPSGNYSGDAFVNVGNFRSTLAAGWFDSEVLIASMNKFGSFAGRLNEVYDQFNENYDVTTSQILTWLNEYMDGTLDIEEAVRKTGLAADEILPVLKELSGEEYELGRRAFAAAQEAKTFEDVVNATKDAVSTAWMNVFENIFGNYEEAKVTWTQLANELWDIFAGPVSNLNDLLTEWHDMGGRDEFIQSVKDMYHAVRSFLDPIGEAWEAIFPAMDAEELFGITKRFRDFTESLIIGDEWAEKIGGSFEKIFGVLKLVTDGVKELTGAFFSGAEGAGTGYFWGLGITIEEIGNALGRFVSNVRSAREAFLATASSEIIIDTYGKGIYYLVDGFQRIKESLSVIGEYASKFLSFNEIFVYYGEAGEGLAGVIHIIYIYLRDTLDAVGDLVKIWTGFDISGPIEAVEEFARSFERAIEDLQSEGKFDELREKIASIFTTFEERFGKITSWFQPLKEALSSIVRDFGVGLAKIFGDGSNIYEALNGGIDSLEGWIDSINEIIRTSETLDTIVTGIKDTIAIISEFLSRFLSLSDTIDTYVEAGGGFAGVLAVIEEKLQIILDTVFDIIQHVTGFDLHYIGDGIIDVVRGIGYALLQVADSVSKAFGWKDNPFGKLLESIDGEYSGFEGIGINLSGIFEKIGGAFSKFGEIVKSIAPGVSDLLSGLGKILGDFIKLIRDLTQGIDLPTLTELVLLTIRAVAAIQLMHKAGDALKAVKDALASWQKTLKVQMLLELAGAIALLAGAAFLISKIDSEQIGMVLGTLGTSFAGLIGILIASQFADAKSLHALPQIALALGAAMILLAKAAGMMVKPMQELGELEDFWPSFGKLTALIGLMSAVLGAFTAANLAGDGGGVAGAAKGISKFVGSMLLLLGVLKLYSMLKIDTLVTGLAKLSAAFIAIGGVAAGLSYLFNLLTRLSGMGATFSDFGSGMLKVVGALAILMGLLAALSLLNWGDLLMSLAKIGVAIAGLAVGMIALAAAAVILGPCLKVLEKLGNVLFKIGAGVALFSGGILLFGVIAKMLGDAADELIDAGMGLLLKFLDALRENSAQIAEDVCIILLDILMVALRLLAEHIPEITEYIVEILGGLMKGVKQALDQGDIDFSELLGGTGLLGGLIAMVWLLKKSGLTTKDFASAGLMLLEASLLLLEVGTLMYGIGLLSDKFGGAEQIKNFGEFCSAIADIFREDWGVGVLIGAIAGLLVLFDKLKLGAIGGGAFLSVIAVIGEVALVIEAMGLIFALGGQINEWIEMIPGVGEGGIAERINKFGEMVIAIADVVGGLVGHLAGGILGGIAEGTAKGAISGFADGLAYLAEKAGGFVGLMSQFDSTSIEACETFAEMILTLTKANLLAGLEKLLGGWLVKDATDFSQFGDSLSGLADGIRDFADKTAGLEQSSIEKAATCAKIIMALAEDMPATSRGLLNMLWEDKKDFGVFGSQLSALGKGLGQFAMDTKGLDPDAVSIAATCAQIIMALSDDLPTTSRSLIGWLFEDKKDFGKFGTQVSKLGSGLKSFQESTADLSPSIIKSAATCTQTLITLAESIPETNGSWWDHLWKNDNSFSTFGSNLEDFGKSFKKYYDKISKIDDVNKLTKITEAISSTIDSFGGLNETDLSKKIKNISDNVLSGIADMFNAEDAKKKTQKSAGKLVEYIADKFAEDDSIDKVGTKITTMVSDAIWKEDVRDGLKRAGNNIISGIQDGMSESFTAEDGLQAKFESFLTALETSIATGGNTGRVKRFLDAGVSLLNGLKNGLTYEENTKSVKEAFKAFLEDLVHTITAQADLFIEAGKTLGKGIVQGVNSDDVAQALRTAGSNYSAGLANGMNDGAAKAQQAATNITSTIVKATKQGLAERSPSRIAYLLGMFYDQGLANGIFDGIPNVEDKIFELTDMAREKIGDSELLAQMKNYGFDFASIFGSGITGWISNGTLSGIGSEFGSVLENGYEAWLDSGMGELYGYDTAETFGNGVTAYAESGQVANATSMITDNVSSVLSDYSGTVLDYGSNTGSTYVYSMADGAMSALDEVSPVLESAVDSVAAPIEERMADVLSYADWIAREYPEGVTTATPVYDFDDLKLQAGELEGLLTAFDMADTGKRKSMISYYGFEGQNEALANLLTKYWNEEPIRLENQKRTTDAILGYKEYLEQQKAMTEIQTVNQQTAYEGIQRTAAEISENQQIADESYTASLDEIKAHVAVIREDLDAVREDIVRLGEMNVYIDSDALVGATADKYDEAFGNMSTLVGRGI